MSVRLPAPLLLCLALLSACKDEEDPKDEPERDRDSPGTDTDDTGMAPRTEQVDTFVQTASAADILWIVDNSCSMQEEQTALREGFAPFMAYLVDSGVDYHVGVVSTDMEARTAGGRLVEDGSGERFIDASLDLEAAVTSFRERANLGTNGSANERGLDAAFAAFSSDTLEENAEFYRDEAVLSMIVVSDENDYSEMGYADFGAWALGLKGASGQVTFSSLVSPAANACPTASEAGLVYIRATDVVGGLNESICTEDWESILTTLATQLPSAQREFLLSLTPEAGTVRVEVDVADLGTVLPTEGTGWTYDATTNSVTFLDYLPPAGSTIRILYFPL